MYGFEPTEEQRMLVDAVRRYAENDLRPAARDAEESGEIPPALIEMGWDIGVLQASIPEAYGGFGEHSAVTGVLAAETRGWGDLACSLAVMAPSTYAMSVLMCGSESQKEKLLPPIIDMEWKPYVSAFIEPDFDFHAGELRTTATKSNGNYVLTGTKTFVPFADQAESILVFASLDGRTQAFVLSPDTKGVEVGEREKFLGLGALALFSLKLEDVQVPLDARLGGEDGFDPGVLLASAQITNAALAVGLSRAALEYSIPYAKEREVWGVPIAQKQSIAFMLAEMAIEVESIQLLVWEAAWQLDAGLDASKSAYLALCGAAEMAMMVTDSAVQVLGGHGYIREHPVELWMRNGRGIPVFTGLAMV